MKFKYLLQEIELISDKQAEAIYSSPTIKPVKPGSNISEKALKKIRYPIDKNSKLIFSKDLSVFRLEDAKMFYTIEPLGDSWDVLFGFAKGEKFKLKAGIDKQKIFSNLKTLIYLVLKIKGIKQAKFSFTGIGSDYTGEDNRPNYINLKFLPAFEKASRMLKTTSERLYNQFKPLQQDFESGKTVLDKVNILLDKLPPESKHKKEIINWFREGQKQNRIGSIRSKMYSSLLSKLGKNVTQKDDTYYFTVALNDII